MYHVLSCAMYVHSEMKYIITTFVYFIYFVPSNPLRNLNVYRYYLLLYFIWWRKCLPLGLIWIILQHVYIKEKKWIKLMFAYYLSRCELMCLSCLGYFVLHLLACLIMHKVMRCLEVHQCHESEDWQFWSMNLQADLRFLNI
jgi:hypothetical protein